MSAGKAMINPLSPLHLCELCSRWLAESRGGLPLACRLRCGLSRRLCGCSAFLGLGVFAGLGLAGFCIQFRFDRLDHLIRVWRHLGSEAVDDLAVAADQELLKVP